MPRHTTRPVRWTALTAAALSAGLAAAASAGTVEVWVFDLESSGEDIAWTSPTTVRTDAARYVTTLEFTRIEADLSLGVLPLGTFNLTEELDPELLVNTLAICGPLPITLIDDALVFPEPPEPASFGATITLVIDELGIGQLDVTDVTLGDIEVDLGPPFGLVTVTITRVGIQGMVTLDPRDAGDVNGDGAVDIADLLAALGGWGPCPTDGTPCEADLDCDFEVSISDVLDILGSWSP